MFKKGKNIKRKTKESRISRKKELIKGLLLAIGLALALRVLIFEPVKIKDDGMESGLYRGDYLLSSSISYKFNSPQQGDIVSFEHPFRSGETLTRRVIAVGGQSVEIVGKMVYVDGQPLDESQTINHKDYRIMPKELSGRDYYAEIVVPSGNIYVLGDNRDECEDSRDFGCINNRAVVGKGLFVYFSWAPDPNAPEWESPYIIPAIQIVFYNLFHFPSRIRWDRLFSAS